MIHQLACKTRRPVGAQQGKRGVLACCSLLDGLLVALDDVSWCVVCLQGGITVADRIVTVSPGYSDEIRTFLGGWGMEGMLSDRGPVLSGIVNGIDEE